MTGICRSPCPLEDPKPTLDSITLSEMQFGPEEQFLIAPKGTQMPALGQALSTKAFLVDGSQCQPPGDEAFIRRTEAVPMRVMFEEKGDRTESVDVPRHSGNDWDVAYTRIHMHDCRAAWKDRAEAKTPHRSDDPEVLTRMV